MIHIRHRVTGIIICSGETVRAAVEEAAVTKLSLAYANLNGEDLGGMCLTDMDFSFASFVGANLCCTDFQRSILSGADFSQANLCEANLCWAKLFDITLTGANIRDMNLRGAVCM